MNKLVKEKRKINNKLLKNGYITSGINKTVYKNKNGTKKRFMPI